MFMRKKRAGLLIRAVMLMALCIAMLSGCSIYDKVTNRWKFDRGEVAGAIAEKDAGDLYEFMSPYMLEENDLWTLTQLAECYAQSGQTSNLVDVPSCNYHYHYSRLISILQVKLK